MGREDSRHSDTGQVTRESGLTILRSDASRRRSIMKTSREDRPRSIENDEEGRMHRKILPSGHRRDSDPMMMQRDDSYFTSGSDKGKSDKDSKPVAPRKRVSIIGVDERRNDQDREGPSARHSRRGSNASVSPSSVDGAVHRDSQLGMRLSFLSMEKSDRKFSGQLDSYTLAFKDPELEEAFMAEFVVRNQRSLRLGLVILGILVGAYIFIDIISFGYKNVIVKVIVVRLSICMLCSFMYWATYKDSFQIANWQPFACSCCLFIGCPIILLPCLYSRVAGVQAVFAVSTVTVGCLGLKCYNAALMEFFLCSIFVAVSNNMPQYGSILEPLDRRAETDTANRFLIEVVFLLTHLVGAAFLMEKFIRKQFYIRWELKTSEKATAVAENALFAKDLKSSFISNLSHEVKHPIISILACGELMAGTPMTEEQKEYATTIHESAVQLFQVIEDVLHFSELDAGTFKLNPQVFNLLEIVEEVVAEQVTLGLSKGLAVSIIYKLPSCIFLGDPGVVLTVLKHLFENTVKVTQKGEVGIVVDKHDTCMGAWIVRFGCFDTGPGIPEENLKFLFQEFTQVRDTLNQVNRGLGLGLALVKGFVNVMKGRVGAVTNDIVKPGTPIGSVFWFEIPLMPIHNPTDRGIGAFVPGTDVGGPKSKEEEEVHTNVMTKGIKVLRKVAPNGCTSVPLGITDEEGNKNDKLKTNDESNTDVVVNAPLFIIGIAKARVIRTMLRVYLSQWPNATVAIAASPQHLFSTEFSGPVGVMSDKRDAHRICFISDIKEKEELVQLDIAKHKLYTMIKRRKHRITKGAYWVMLPKDRQMADGNSLSRLVAKDIFAILYMPIRAQHLASCMRDFLEVSGKHLKTILTSYPPALTGPVKPGEAVVDIPDPPRATSVKDYSTLVLEYQNSVFIGQEAERQTILSFEGASREFQSIVFRQADPGGALMMPRPVRKLSEVDEEAIAKGRRFKKSSASALESKEEVLKKILSVRHGTMHLVNFLKALDIEDEVIETTDKKTEGQGEKKDSSIPPDGTQGTQSGAAQTAPKLGPVAPQQQQQNEINPFQASSTGGTSTHTRPFALLNSPTFNSSSTVAAAAAAAAAAATAVQPGPKLGATAQQQPQQNEIHPLHASSAGGTSTHTRPFALLNSPTFNSSSTATAAAAAAAAAAAVATANGLASKSPLGTSPLLPTSGAAYDSPEFVDTPLVVKPIPGSEWKVSTASPLFQEQPDDALQKPTSESQKQQEEKEEMQQPQQPLNRVRRQIASTGSVTRQAFSVSTVSLLQKLQGSMSWRLGDSVEPVRVVMIMLGMQLASWPFLKRAFEEVVVSKVNIVLCSTWLGVFLALCIYTFSSHFQGIMAAHPVRCEWGFAILMVMTLWVVIVCCYIHPGLASMSIETWLIVFALTLYVNIFCRFSVALAASAAIALMYEAVIINHHAITFLGDVARPLVPSGIASREDIRIIVVTFFTFTTIGSLLTTSYTLDTTASSEQSLTLVVMAATEAARKATEAEAANQATTQFISNLNMEVRTPLASIIGMSELLLSSEPPLNILQEDLVFTVQQASQQLSSLVDNVLDVKKIDNGFIQLQEEVINIREQIEERVLSMCHVAYKKRLRVIMDMRIHHELFLGDPLRLGQIMTNVLSNAITFTNQGDILIKAEEIQSMNNDPTTPPMPPDSGGRTRQFSIIRVSCKDTGIGMSKENLEKVVNTLNKVDAESISFGKLRHRGTGIGLTIVKSLVSLMGGACGITSELDQGTTFWFTMRLPYIQPTDPEASDPNTQSTLSFSWKSSIPIKLLLISPSPTECDVIKRYAMQWGHQCSVEENTMLGVQRLTGKRTSLLPSSASINLLSGLNALEKDNDSGRPPGVLSRAGRTSVRLGKDNPQADAVDPLSIKLIVLDAEVLSPSGQTDDEKMLLHTVNSRNLKIILLVRAGMSIHQWQHFNALPFKKPVAFSSFFYALESIIGLTELAPDTSPTGVPHMAPPAAASTPASPRKEVVAVLPPSSMEPARTHRKVRLLVVEDHVINQRIIKNMLEKEGVDFQLVSNGKEALDALEPPNHGFDILLTDCQTPVMDGFEATKAIRAREQAEGRPRIPIIALTALALASDRERCFAAGMDDCLIKPLKKEALQNMLAKFGPQLTSLVLQTNMDSKTLRVAGQSAAEGAGSPAVSPGVPRKVRLLVVEDHIINQRIIKNMLEKEGVKFELVSNGKEALDALEPPNHGFDILLTDCQTPVMDGFEATKAIRTREQAEGRRRMPIIALTALALASDKERCFAAGMDDCLIKPLKKEALQNMLAKYGPQLSTLVASNSNHPGPKTPRAPGQPGGQRGSAFSFSSRAGAAVPAGGSAPSPAAAKPRQMKVLIVEDHLVNQKILKNMCEKEGILFGIVNNGKEAVDAVEPVDHGYDLILTDCQTPIMDGFEATMVIREREKAEGRRRLPIIAVTGLALQSDQERCFAAGMDDFLTKPVKKEALKKVLSKWGPKFSDLLAEAAPELAAQTVPPSQPRQHQSIVPRIASETSKVLHYAV